MSFVVQRWYVDEKMIRGRRAKVSQASTTQHASLGEAVTDYRRAKTSDWVPTGAHEWGVTADNAVTEIAERGDKVVPMPESLPGAEGALVARQAMPTSGRPR